MSGSCLVAKLSNYIHLTAEEQSFLDASEASPLRYARRSTIAENGERMSAIYVLKSGWLIAHTRDASGAEVIAEVYHPGDVVGVSQLGCDVLTLTYVAATDIELCALPVNTLPRLFVDFPRLAAFFFAFVALERASMIDRLRAMGRMSARNCVALFLLQTQARLTLTGSVEPLTGRFSMPLSQETIGNAVGLSTVSVNRAIQLLESEGHLRRDGRLMELVHRDSLAEEVEFVDRLYRIDTSWIPSVDVVEATRRP